MVFPKYLTLKTNHFLEFDCHRDKNNSDIKTIKEILKFVSKNLRASNK